MDKKADEGNKGKGRKVDEVAAVDVMPKRGVFAQSSSGGKHTELNGKKAPPWLLTFTDIMALMLTFFVLLYSMSTPEKEKWDDLTSALTQGFSKFKSAPKFSGEQREINIERLSFKRALSLEYLEGLIHDAIAKDTGLSNVKLFNQGDHLILSFPADLLFESGQATMAKQGKTALFNVGAPLSRIRNRIEVIGHTDPNVITGDSFDSNWDLSVMRALEVATILHDVGYTRPMTVRGMAATRYDELPEDMERTRKLDLARRVDIIIMNDDGNLRGFAPSP